MLNRLRRWLLPAAATGMTVGFMMTMGAGPSAPPVVGGGGGGACPQGEIAADGCASAPAGTAQYSTALDGYTVRPSWNVAGVDYYVGIPEGTTLTPWRSASITNADINLTSGRVNCSSPGASVTVDGIDFSPASGVKPYIWDGNGCTWTIQNSYFACPGDVWFGNIFVDNVTLLNNEFDQNGCTTYADLSSMTVLGGNVTVKYNWFRRGFQHVVESAGPLNLDMRFNLIDDMLPQGGAALCVAGSLQPCHENWLQLSGTTTISNITTDYNFAYEHTSGYGNGEGFQYYCNSGPCTVTTASLQNNTIVALTGTGRSNAINGGDVSHPGDVQTGTVSNNFFDHTAGNAFYSGTICSPDWTGSGNKNMVNGLTINPCNNAES